MTVNQHKMLQMFSTSSLTIEQAKKLDRRTFDCLCRHRWLDAKYDHKTDQYVFVLSSGGSMWLDFVEQIRSYKLVAGELSNVAYMLMAPVNKKPRSRSRLNDRTRNTTSKSGIGGGKGIYRVA